MSSALSIRQLTKTYGNGFQALKGIDLDVAEGDFFALLGPNGAGKSTTIGIISTLVNKSGGAVEVFGHDLDRDPSGLKRCLGVVPQEFNFSQFEKVFDIVVTQAGYYGIPLKVARERAEQYLNQLASLKKVSGTTRESVVREAFKDLLKGWARSHDLVFVPEYEIASPTKERRYIDGALLHALRMPFGYWEAKDEKDDLDAEIAHKFKRGYPQDNIIFEDSTEAVLIQNRQEVMRCAVDDVDNLGKLVTRLCSH